MPLERSASAQAAALLSHLDAVGAVEFGVAMRTVERSLTPNPRGTPEPIVLRPHQVGDIGWIAHRQGLLYAQEHGYDQSFEALVAEIAAKFVRGFDAKHERCWVSEQGGRIVGAVFVVRKRARHRSFGKALVGQYWTLAL